MTTFDYFVLPKITESATVEVLDNCGKVLFTKQYKTIPSNNEIKLPLDNLSKGTYLFIVTTKKMKNYKPNLS